MTFLWLDGRWQNPGQDKHRTRKKALLGHQALPYPLFE